MQEEKVHTGLWWGDLRQRDHLKDPGVDKGIIWRWIFRKLDARAWTRLIWLRIGKGGSYEPSGPLKCAKFLD
jgi:hypothetical protein